MLQISPNDEMLADEREIEAIVSKQKLTLKFGQDFETFQSLVSTQPKRSGVAPIFKPNCETVGLLDQFWMVALNENGKLVHTQAIKLIDLKGASFEAFLRFHIWNIFPKGYCPEYERRNYHLSDDAQRISGRITYHGELWLEETLRGGCLAPLLTRLCLLRSLRLWRPDYFTGFQRPLSALRGLAARESYTCLDQRSLTLRHNNGIDIFEIWLVWMSRASAEFNLRLPPQFLVETYE